MMQRRRITTGMGALGDYAGLVAAFAARGVDPEAFEAARPGRPFPDPVTCLQIQCGAITQDEAGIELLADCSFAGYAGAMSCAAPLCAPYCGQTARTVSRAAQPLPVAPRVEQMFLDAPLRGCSPVYWGSKFGGPYSDSAPCSSCSGSFISEHPLIALALVAAGAYGIYRWRASKNG